MSTSKDAIKPTLLAFHGSGSNAAIHTVQLARLTRTLIEKFNIVSLEAPFPSPPGPGILPFFADCGPYKRWAPPPETVPLSAMKAKTLSSELPSEVESLVRETVSRITTSGGRVVGAIGFSQGTRVVAGLLRGVQIKARTGARSEDWMASFAFGLCVCGSHPPPLVPAGVLGCPEVVALGDVKRDEVLQEKIAMPMLHVQGSRDVGKSMEDELIQVHFEVANGCSEVVEWDMGHHYPMRVKESEKMRDWLVCQLERVDAEREIGV